ncbi:MAG TPA: ATP-binding protein [Candidatus Omnitrophota bacterium]|nr:ATP-binding protein [Candidatus Omnitrophota bacterium]HRZ14786.1 ATP-binding protein [Candidatus Omnitrophota bacterium]
MNAINYFSISFLLGALACYVSGVWVLFKNSRSSVNKSWFLLSLTAGTWSVSHFIMAVTPDYNLAWRFAYILYASAILIPVCYLYFVFALLNAVSGHKKHLLLALIGSVIFLSLLSSHWFIKDVTAKAMFRFYDDLGPLAALFVAYFAVVPTYGLLLLLRSAGTKGKEKFLQIQYVAIASLFGFIGGGSTFGLAFNIPLLPYPIILFVFYPLLITFAILRYRLMAINAVITRTGIFTAVYAIVLGVPLVLVTIGKNWLMHLLGPNWWLAPLTLLMFLATIGPFVYINLQKRAEAILLRKQRAYRETLRSAAAEMTRIRNLEQLTEFIFETIAETIHVSHAALYTWDTPKNSFILLAGHHMYADQPPEIAQTNPLITFIENLKEPLIREEINRKAEENPGTPFNDIAQEMQALKATLIVPSFLENRLANLLILGDKAGGDTYQPDDLAVFSVLANQISLAIENAALYQNMENQVKQRTQQLMDVQKQLVQAEKLATIGTLAGGVAHEINNPLTAILTNAQMLLAVCENLDADTKESLEIIEEATKRCKIIVQKLMTYSKKPLETTMVYDFNLLDVITTAVSFLKFQFEQDNVKTVLNAPDKNYPIRGNHNEMEQVITNVLLNARDAIKQIRPDGTIEIELSQDQNWVNVSIKDEGGGIPQEIIGRIFDPFFTTKEVGKGLGLGLSICQSIIDKHHGMIRVKSKTGKGTIVTIDIPRAKK